MKILFASLFSAYVLGLAGYIFAVWLGVTYRAWWERQGLRPAMPLLGLAMLFCVFGHPTPGHAGERAGGSDAALLAGIADVEGWRGGRGPSGEIGPYQMMPATWARYTGTARERAVKHLRYLEKLLHRRGAAVVPFNLALCWNAGETKALTGRAELRHYDYARRVVARMEAAQ